MNDIVLTLDIDWAPDFVIASIAEMLSEAGVCATWFVTHDSPALDLLRNESEIFELGIHPNLLPGSTQGSIPTDVFGHCMEIVPEATAMRMHGLVQSGPLLDTALNETPIRIDLSLFLPRMPGIRPIDYERPGGILVRIPVFWEDRYEMEVSRPSWRLGAELLVPGLKVFSFHPIHVYLNSSLSVYDEVKRLGSMLELSAKDIAPHIREGDGPRTLFRELVAHLSASGHSRRVAEIAHMVT